MRFKNVNAAVQVSKQNAPITRRLSYEKALNVISVAKIQQLPDANSGESTGKLLRIHLMRLGGEVYKVLIVISVVLQLMCHSAAAVQDSSNSVLKALFGTLASGQRIYSFTLKNRNGMSVTVISYGATVVSICVPDRNGRNQDVVLGYDSLSGYVQDHIHCGGLIGRYANRIGQGRFTLDGRVYHVSINDRGSSIHGGKIGFNKRVWNARVVSEAQNPTVQMKYTSPNGEEGFPGTLKVTVTYSLSNENEFIIKYRAVTDKPTIINLTNHTYFNLSGDPTSSILDEVLMINANEFTPTDSLQIATGEISEVAGTPLDFRRPTVIGLRINKDYSQLKYGMGYDENWVINNYNGRIHKAATLYDPRSGRFMEVFTDQPGVQFYSGNHLNGSIIGKGGVHYRPRCALTLECQHFPYSPDGRNFPSVVLRPGQVYRQTTIYKFSVARGRI